MRLYLVCLLAVLIATMTIHAQTTEKFAEIWDKEHVSKMMPSDMRHSDLEDYLEGVKKLGVTVKEVGRSGGDRAIYQAEWGRGPLRIFMWSQMHGDEPTATSALIDMLTFLQKNRTKDWVKKIEQTVTIRAVPMLNPDGAEIYQRRNLQGIDINRDAVDLKTPEAQLLKRLRDEWSPAIGFNLHNQQALTTVGSSPMQASISLLVVYGDAAKTTSPGQERNTRLASAIVAALQKFIPGHIARYDDGYTATAFGDNFSAWGTPTILIETGALYGKDELYLVKMNFIAFLTMLQALATGSEATQSTAPYLSLIPNSSGGLSNFVFRRANLVSQEKPTDPTVAAATVITAGDIAANIERRRASFVAPVMIRAVGPALMQRGLEEYDASNFNVVQRYGRTTPGEMAELFFFKRDRTIDWSSEDLEKQADAVFSLAKWSKGSGIVPKMK